MLEIFNGDCLMIMEGLPENSVDVIFCDLPYGITSCKWDCKIDLKLFWENIMRIKKINTPIFMTTTTKFGVDLIQSCPKNCPFRYDLVWVKSAPAGFLCAKKMPMRKHEMVYVFYEKLPFYDLSSHTHKFLKDKEVIRTDEGCNGLYGKEEKKVFIYDENGKLRNSEPRYDPPLPVSCIYDQEHNSELYGNVKRDDRKNKIVYDPPLPVSCIYDNGTYKQEDNADELYREMGRKGNESAYDPPLPTTMLEIKSTRGKHSTEKPVALMEWIFKYYSKEGDVILDPTMGSGSTGVACQNMGLDFIGIEMDHEIFQVAKERLKL
tara:strand:+ start:342 stop:1304 length:963 start_codon:yes stop_codon:yes gene_type:complete